MREVPLPVGQIEVAVGLAARSSSDGDVSVLVRAENVPVCLGEVFDGFGVVATQYIGSALRR